MYTYKIFDSNYDDNFVYCLFLCSAGDSLFHADPMCNSKIHGRSDDRPLTLSQKRGEQKLVARASRMRARSKREGSSSLAAK